MISYTWFIIGELFIILTIFKCCINKLSGNTGYMDIETSVDVSYGTIEDIENIDIEDETIPLLNSVESLNSPYDDYF